MRVGMGLLVLAAAGLGWFLAGRLGGVLPFPAEPEPETRWRILGIGAAIFGLTLGGSRAGSGTAPALGPMSARLGTALMTATEAPAIWTMRLARRLDRIEAALDSLAQGIATGAVALAGIVQSAEHGLKTAAQRAAGGISRLALGTERAEAFGFGRGGDRLAAAIAFGGERLRALQAGRLDLYTLALFVWVAAALAVGALMLWL